MTARAAAWALFLMAAAALAAGQLWVALFLAGGSLAAYLAGPTDAQLDARRRNQAHRSR